MNEQFKYWIPWFAVGILISVLLYLKKNSLELAVSVFVIIAILLFLGSIKYKFYDYQDKKRNRDKE